MADRKNHTGLEADTEVFLDGCPYALPDNYPKQGWRVEFHVHRAPTDMGNKDLVDILVVDASWLWDLYARMSGMLDEDNRVEESASIAAWAVVRMGVDRDRVRSVMMGVDMMILGRSVFALMEEVAGIVALEARP